MKPYNTIQLLRTTGAMSKDAQLPTKIQQRVCTYSSLRISGKSSGITLADIDLTRYSDFNTLRDEIKKRVEYVVHNKQGSDPCFVITSSVFTIHDIARWVKEVLETHDGKSRSRGIVVQLGTYTDHPKEAEEQIILASGLLTYRGLSPWSHECIVGGKIIPASALTDIPYLFSEELHGETIVGFHPNAS